MGPPGFVGAHEHATRRSLEVALADAASERGPVARPRDGRSASRGARPWTTTMVGPRERRARRCSWCDSPRLRTRRTRRHRGDALGRRAISALMCRAAAIVVPAVIRLAAIGTAL